MAYTEESFDAVNNKFKGKLSADECKIIDKVRKRKELPKLRNSIYNFPLSFRKEAREKGMSAYQYALENNVLDSYLGELRDYQTVGAAFMYRSPRSMLGDAAGIGKTPQICSMLNTMRNNADNPVFANTVYGNKKRILVAAEGSAVGQIAGEIEKFTGLRVTVLHSTADKMKRQTSKFYLTRVLDGTLPEPEEPYVEPEVEYTKTGKPKKVRPPKRKKPVIVIDFDVLVITHSTLRSDTFFTWLSRVINEFSTFILDESYVVKTPDTAISGYVQALCDKVERVHFLNATMFETKLMDIINQFSLLDSSLLPPKRWVEQNFCVFRRETFIKRGGHGERGVRWALVAYKNQDWFREALSYVYLTRKKKDVKASNTQRYYQTYLIPQTKPQKSAIRLGYRYFEVLNCPSLCVDLEIKNTPQDVPKLERLIQLVTEDFEGQRIMIYVWHIEMQSAIKELLEESGLKAVILNGATDDRDEARDGFNSGEYDVIITNAKRSLNLHSGDVCILYSMETNPATIEQIVARIDRNVNDDDKTFILLAYEGEESNFFINTVKQRAVDGSDLADIVSETVIKFGELLLDSLEAE